MSAIKGRRILVQKKKSAVKTITERKQNISRVAPLALEEGQELGFRDLREI